MTGYTSILLDNDYGVKEWALVCARAFGALIMMRDEPMEAPIPQRQEPSDYHVKELTRLNTELGEWEVMTQDERLAWATTKATANHQSNVDYLAKSKVQNERLQEKLKQVNAWNPPKDYSELKRFMVEQITMCIDDLSWAENRVKESEDTESNAYRICAERIDSLNKDIKYHEEQNRKEIERVEGRNEWIDGLRKALEEVSA